jgi:cell division protein FtsB
MLTNELVQPLDRRERKKLQNREAAQRYRMKKQEEKVDQSDILEQLVKRNASLKASIRTLETEVDIMKRLLRDVQIEASKTK